MTTPRSVSAHSARPSMLLVSFMWLVGTAVRLFAGGLALVLLLLALPALVGSADASEERSLVIRAKGDTGEELMQVEHRGEVLSAFFVSSTWNLYPTDLTVGPGEDQIELADLRVSFVNDKHGPTIDRNLRVDWVKLDGTTYQSEDANTFSLGTWSADSECRAGKKQRQVLHCNGYFQYAKNTVSLDVRAKGATGSEQLEIHVGPDQDVVGSAIVTTTYDQYRFELPTNTKLSDVRVAFVNDQHDNNADRNLRVSSVLFDGVKYTTKSADTLSVGTTRGCGGGKVGTATLWCNGYFQFDTVGGEFALDGEPTIEITATSYTITWTTTTPARYDLMSVYFNGSFSRGQTFEAFTYDTTHVLTGDRTKGPATALMFQVTPISEDGESLDRFAFEVGGY